MEFILSLFSKATDDIGGNGDPRTMFQKVITYFGKIFDWVFSVHFGEDVVVACLDRNVNERKYSGMVQEMSNGPEMFQHVRWVGHTNLELKTKILSS